MSDNEWHQSPTCPYCGCSHDESADWPDIEHDGDKSGITCNNCERDFDVTLCVTYEWQSAKPTREAEAEACGYTLCQADVVAELRARGFGENADDFARGVHVGAAKRARETT